MGPWTYYSPFLAGLVLPFGVHQLFFDSLAFQGLEPWQKWLQLGGYALVLGITLQLMMIGCQGAFAQVLPVPVGKSVRGRSAVVAGAGLVIGTLAGLAAYYIWAQGSPQIAMIAGGVAAGGAVIAAIAYVWAWPMAVRDFAAR